MLLALFEPEAAYSEMIPELSDWFQENYGAIYGGSDCHSILGGSMANKALRCPQVVENTYRKARELLEDYGRSGRNAGGSRELKRVIMYG